MPNRLCNKCKNDLGVDETFRASIKCQNCKFFNTFSEKPPVPTKDKQVPTNKQQVLTKDQQVQTNDKQVQSSSPPGQFGSAVGIKKRWVVGKTTNLSIQTNNSNNTTISPNNENTSSNNKNPKQMPTHVVRNKTVSPLEKFQPQEDGDIKQCPQCKKIDLFGLDACKYCNTPYEKEVLYSHANCQKGGVSFKKNLCTACTLTPIGHLPEATNVPSQLRQQVVQKKRAELSKLCLTQSLQELSKEGNEAYNNLDTSKKEELNKRWQQVNPGRFHNDNFSLGGNEHAKIGKEFKDKILTQLTPNEVRAYATTLKQFMFGRFGFAKEFAEVFTAEQLEAVAQNKATHEYALTSVINELGARFTDQMEQLEKWQHEQTRNTNEEQTKKIQGQFEKTQENLKNTLKRKLDGIKAHKTEALDLRLGVAYRLIGETYETTNK